MDLLPALQILSTDGRVIVQQGLAQHRICLVDDAVVEGRQALGVLVVRTGAELQEGFHRLEVVALDRSMHRRQALLRPVVEEGAAIH